VEKAEFSNVTASGSYNYHRAEKFILRIHVLIRMKCERKVSWLAWFTLEGFESDLMKHEVHLAQCIEKLNWRHRKKQRTCAVIFHSNSLEVQKGFSCSLLEWAQDKKIHNKMIDKCTRENKSNAEEYPKLPTEYYRNNVDVTNQRNSTLAVFSQS